MKNDKEEDCFLIAAGYLDDSDSLIDEKLLTDTLLLLPKSIGMNIIAIPKVLIANNNPGLEGYVPIDQSNITISTYINTPRFIASIHSCTHFDFKAVLVCLNNAYKPKKLKHIYISELDLKG